jgi:hypothetical protein
VVHRQQPREPKRGMVYDVLIHLSSIEDTRRLGADGRPLFFPLHFNLGATDTAQNVASSHAPQEEAEIFLGGDDHSSQPVAPLWHS